MKLRKSQAVAALLVTLTCAILYFTLRPASSYTHHLDTRYQAMRLLGTFISQEHPGEGVLLLANPFVLKPKASEKIKDHDTMGHEGLKSGLAENTSLTKVYPAIRSDYARDPSSVVIPPSSKTPLSFVVETASLDELADAHPEATIITSLIGLPQGVQKLKVWKREHPARFALLLPDFRLLGRSKEVIRQFKNGKILAAVIHDKASGEPLIATKENIGKLLASQPRSFGF
jgi:hypothetical protein